MNKDVHIFQNGNAWLPQSAALITFTNSKTFLEEPDADPIITTYKKKYRGYVPWGEDNDLPQAVMKKCGKSPIISSNHAFNIFVGYGEGIVPARIINKGDKRTFEIVDDNEEINEFLENNDINGYLLEQLTDVNYFNITFPEIILNQETPSERKVVELNHKESAFSRWEEANENTGIIENCFYSAKFGTDKVPEKKEIDVTAVLNSKNPILDLKRKIGREKYPDLKTKDDKVYRYIVPVSIPTPGRVYYPKAPYYTLFESGWYDYAIQIPEFKKALMTNQATIKFIVYITDNYFEVIFAEEGITKDADQKARIKLEYKNINDYLTGAKNAGKAVISKIKYTPEGKEIASIKFEALDNKLNGGEYIEDSEEVTSIMCYAQSVHPSLVGSVPGKGKNINGTEARELFLIKHAMMKPVRDRILKPLYLVKAINNWPKDIHFIIPGIRLTTLDKNKNGVESEIED